MKEQTDDTAVTLIAKYISNELDNSEKEQFDLWLNASDEHRNELEKAQKIWEMASPTEVKEFNTDVAWDKMNNRIHIGEKQPVIGRRQFLIPAMRIAASILILVSLSFAIRWYYVGLKYIEVVAVNQKILKPILLPDGTRVYLNAGSKIKYPREFGNIRKVELTGEAFFNVTRNEKSPFIIQTANARVKVLGTSFNVSAYLDSDSVKVVVESGTVELASRKRSENIRLTKGNSGIYIAKSDKLVKSAGSDVNSFAWKTNVITFDNADLNYVAKTLKKLFAKPITFDNEKLKSFRLNAKYEDLDLNGIFKALKATHCLDAHKMGDGYLITGSGC